MPLIVKLNLGVMMENVRPRYNFSVLLVSRAVFQQLVFEREIMQSKEKPPVTQAVLIKTEFAFLDKIDSCFTFDGQRDPDGKIIETEKSCIEKALASLRFVSHFAKSV